MSENVPEVNGFELKYRIIMLLGISQKDDDGTALAPTRMMARIIGVTADDIMDALAEMENDDLVITGHDGAYRIIP